MNIDININKNVNLDKGVVLDKGRECKSIMGDGEYVDEKATEDIDEKAAEELTEKNEKELDIETICNKCNKCNKTFSSQQSLKTHQLTIKCVKTKNNNKCEYCDKQFSSKQMLTYHHNICVNKKIESVKSEKINHYLFNNEKIIRPRQPSFDLFFSGVCKIEDRKVNVYLPPYIEKNVIFTVSLTPKNYLTTHYFTKGVVDGNFFTVYCDDNNTEFFWQVYGHINDL